MRRRLDQILASLGYCSRSEARLFLKTHAVTLRDSDGVLRDTSAKVDPANVLVDGAPLDHPEGILVVLNKPTGLVCSHDPREGPNVYSLLPPRWRARNPQVTSVGRLDKDTSGLILLTDQTALVHRLTSPKHKVPKVYRATVANPVPPEAVGLFASGSLVLDGEKQPCLPAQLRILNPNTAELTLTEGRYHQVRRMLASQGSEVLALHREKFGPLDLDGIEPGAFRELPINFFD
ncbi:pseudouridine synthase [Ereboglobus luteus]|uniref:Pseudouridine synthase n=1 Tax=Ereboglobus luteus TaxID=1796921 RepID=A0A2U8E662_9BACT|nr:pseudouridine synthase [Ereboglobus luteus]AWI10347.1 16S rRNA pseudouridine(516) synthase [Ereboglobus luteus]